MQGDLHLLAPSRIRRTVTLFHVSNLDPVPFGHIDMPEYGQLRYCSWHDADWRSLLVQSFVHAPQVKHLPLPPCPDLRLVLCTAGEAITQVISDGITTRRRWTVGRLQLMAPTKSSALSYSTTSRLSTIQVHIPQAVVARTTAQLGLCQPDFEALSERFRGGDAVAKHLIRSLPARQREGDMYAESAATFLAVHLLSRVQEQRIARSAHSAVRMGITIMQDRLAEPLTLADIAAEVHLSVYHFVRVFRNATGETPHRYLTKLRVQMAQRLLSQTNLPIADIAQRCGFSEAGALSTAFLRHVGVRPSVYRADHPPHIRRNVATAR